MVLQRRLLIGSLLAALGACQQDGASPTTSVASANSSGAPNYSDPLAGLYNIPGAAVPNDQPVNYYTPGASRTGRPASRAVLTMAVVPGANIDRLTTYFEARGKGNSDLDLSASIRRVVDVLKERYPWLELMDDIATAQQRNVSLTLVVDIRAVLGGTFEATQAEIDVIVFDEQRKPITRLLVEGRARSFQEALGQALTKLNDKAKTYLT